MQEDRATIYTLMDTNLVVEAGAGTGKTTALITRLCLCILAKNIPVEKLVALTFTEKAAADIKERLLVALQGIQRIIKNYPQEKEENAREDADDPIPQNDTSTEARVMRLLREEFGLKDEEVSARAQQALMRLDRASIGTIHAFCADILRAFPLEADLAPNAQIDKGQKQEGLFEARWNRFLDEELGEQAPRAAKWKRVLSAVSFEQLRAFAMSLCGGKITHYDYYANKTNFIALCQRNILCMRALADQGVEHARGKKKRGIENSLYFAARSLERTIAFVNRQPVPEMDLEPANIGNKAVSGWTEEDFAQAKRLVSFAEKVTPEKQTVFLEAYELVKDLCTAVRQDYRKNGLLGYDDLLVKTRDLLQRDLRVRRLLKEKFDVLFIDEFQDTDPVQGELLLFLAEEKTSFAKQWKDIRLEAGKLFVVGDPKQSIYRFRGADITAYEKFTQLILAQNGRQCFLRENFRSFPEIVEVANAVCSYAMVQKPSFQPFYEPIFTTKIPHGRAVEWMFVHHEKMDAEKLRENQGEAIAKWIADNVGRLTLANGEKLSYHHIAILMHTSTSNAGYIRALRRYGIAFNVEVDKGFFSKQEMDDMLNVLKVLSDPQDRVALTGVLRGPLGCMSDAEIYELSQRGELYLTAKTEHPKAQFCYRLLNRFLQKAGRLSAQELVEEILSNTFFPETCAIAYDGERTLRFLQCLGKLMEKYAHQDPFSIDRFFEWLQKKLEARTADVDVAQGDDAADAVSLLTIHKSKGLEFPVVIFADISKDKRRSEQQADPLYSWQNDFYGLAVGNIQDINMAFLEEEKIIHEQCEDIRCLYVALTRAREKLLLVADSRKVNAYLSAFAARGLLPNAQEKPGALTYKQLLLPVTYVEGKEPSSFRYLRHYSDDQQESPLSIPSWKDAFAARAEKYEQMRQFSRKQIPRTLEGDMLTQEQQRGAELGTICHRALELWLTHPSDTVQEAVKKAAAWQGVSHRAEEAVQIIVPFVQSDLFAQIKQCKLLACEMPFSYLLSDGEVSSGTMDAVLERPDGAIWVIDYKTDKIKSGAEKETLSQKYEAQLRVYQTAAQKIFVDKKIICSAIFLRTFAAAEL